MLLRTTSLTSHGSLSWLSLGDSASGCSSAAAAHNGVYTALPTATTLPLPSGDQLQPISSSVVYAKSCTLAQLPICP